MPAVQIRIYQHNPEGAVMVKFVTDDAATKCVDLMNGRYFGGQQVVAQMWDGKTNYFVAPRKETKEEQAARLDQFSKQNET